MSSQRDLPIDNRLRKHGDPRPETIEIQLSDEQRAERRKRACDLRDQQAALAEEKKLAMSAFGQRKKALENLEAVARQQASSGIEVAAVMVQDYLTASNEVVSLRLDASGQASPDIVARRTATADELQDDLFGGHGQDGFGHPS